MKHVASFTETHVSTPGCIAITCDDDLTVAITVRTRGREGFTGNVSQITMASHELFALAESILAARQPAKPSKK